MKWKAYSKRSRIIAYCGIDNGVTGAVATLHNAIVSFFPTPVMKEQDYTKKVKGITRILPWVLYNHLEHMCIGAGRVYILLERPMVNHRRFVQSASAVRAHEATLIVFSMLQAKYGNVRYKVIDSKEWQASMIPRAKGDDLKPASTMLATEKFPEYSLELMKNDGDALCILLYMIERDKWIHSGIWRTPN
jgi:hypothetical protein